MNFTDETIKAELAVCEAATEGPLRGGNAGTLLPDSDGFMCIEEAVVWFRELLECSDDHTRPIAFIETDKPDGESLTVAVMGNGPTSYDNAKFFYHARTGYPAALKELLRLRETVDKHMPDELAVDVGGTD